MNKNNTLHLSLLLASMNLSASFATSAHNTSPIAYFADKDHDAVIAFNPRTMQTIESISTHGHGPYPVDKTGENSVYVTTRNSQSVDVINNNDLSVYKTISLPHYPRSVTYNKFNNLAIVSGVKKPVTSIIDTSNHSLVATVGNDHVVTPTDFGGGLATGHPYWVSPTQFLLLDRANRKLDLYSISQLGGEYKVNMTYSLPMPTSVHHIMAVPNASGWDKNIFYAIAEGSPNNGIAPAVVAFELSGEHLYHRQTLHLPVTNTNVKEMGAHHGAFHPDGKHIYLGSNEGITYVIDRVSMRVISTIETGKGNGHTTMNAQRMIAIATNHTDSFMTVIDLNTHTKVANIDVSELATSKTRKTQAHTSSFDPNNSRFFYTAASDDGRIIEIDLDTLSISREIELLGSYPIQGTFVW